MSGLLARLRLPGWSQDVLIAGFVTVMQIAGTRGTASAPGAEDPDPFAYCLLAASGLALVVRRRFPVAVFVLLAANSGWYYFAGYPDGPGWVSLFVATYTLTAHGDGRRSLWIAATGIAALVPIWLLTGDLEPRAEAGWVFFRIGAAIMAAALGESVRTRRVIAAEAQERAERAERTREEEAQRRVDAERLRIAREVHDTVAHAIAIVNVQAGVTAHVLHKRGAGGSRAGGGGGGVGGGGGSSSAGDPVPAGRDAGVERAREALLTIEQTSARALRELRATLGMLRDLDDHTATGGLAQLDEIAGQAREAGLDVKLEVATPPRELPSAVDRAAYRILQESITNVIRHAGPARVTISVSYRPTDLVLSVVDDGRGLPTGAAGEGRGIVGMRERCGLLGGELTAGPGPAGGFRVRARLPLNGDAAISA